MQVTVPSVSTAADRLPGLANALAPSENVQATLQVDLDDSLRFASGWLALTPKRLLWSLRGGGVESLDLHAEMTLLPSEHAGIGSLELVDRHQRLVLWRHTAIISAPAQ